MKHYYLLLLFLLFFSGNIISQIKLESTAQIPIPAWYSIPANETSVERYQELKDAGITCSFTGFSDADEVQKILDAAEKDVSIVAASVYENTMELDPGDAAIYMFATTR